MTPSHSTQQHPDQTDPQDAMLKRELRALPDPQPSHGFDARMVEMLGHESSQPARTRRDQAESRRSLAGGSLALDRLRGVLGSPWGLAIVFGLLMASAATFGLQWFSPEEDITKVDLLMLMSQEVL